MARHHGEEDQPASTGTTGTRSPAHARSGAARPRVAGSWAAGGRAGGAGRGTPAAVPPASARPRRRAARSSYSSFDEPPGRVVLAERVSPPPRARRRRCAGAASRRCRSRCGSARPASRPVALTAPDPRPRAVRRGVAGCRRGSQPPRPAAGGSRTSSSARRRPSPGRSPASGRRAGVVGRRPFSSKGRHVAASSSGCSSTYAPALLGEPEHPSSIAVHTLDQPFVLELLDGRVHRPGAGLPGSAGALGDLLDDLVAVHRLHREHVEDRRAHVTAAHLRAAAPRTLCEPRAGRRPTAAGRRDRCRSTTL